MHLREIRRDGAYILYDADSVTNAEAFSFDPEALAQRGAVLGRAHGRGSALFLAWEGREYLLRHYHRGGAVARLLGDRYLWSGLARTRAWREFAITARLHAQGLAVPRPALARVERVGCCFYRADLVTERIAGARTLAQVLKREALPVREWMAIGAMLRRFHRRGVFHADLNAHNILYDVRGRLYLIDFDRARLRRPAGRWRLANLARLQRSLRKLTRLRPGFHYAEPADWAALLRGYGR